MQFLVRGVYASIRLSRFSIRSMRWSIFEAQLGRGIVDFHGSQVAFDRGHSGRQLTKAGLDTVEPLIDAREIGAEKIENV